jgi:hypothetical protein
LKMNIFSRWPFALNERKNNDGIIRMVAGGIIYYDPSSKRPDVLNLEIPLKQLTPVLRLDLNREAKRRWNMRTVAKTLLAGALGAGALAFMSAGASAAVACSGNVCWHTHGTYNYPTRAHVVVHPEDWRWGPHVTIREHEGRGYWRGDRWVGW